MDSIDYTILELLKQDSRRSFVDIAKRVNLTEGAIRRRVKNLMREGILERFTIDTKSEVEAIILIKTDPRRTKEVTEMLKQEAIKVFEASGDYDIAAFVSASTLGALNEKVDRIRALQAIQSTSTLIKMNHQ